MSRAIVLSGGGAVGIAWQTGLCAGLAEQGVSLARADAVFGTSAGSAVGAQLALGRDLGQALERFRRSERPPRSTSETGERAAPTAAGAPQRPQLGGLFLMMAKAMAAESDPQKARAELGRMALEAQTISEEQFMRGFAYLAGDGWPRGFACTAVDTESGAFAVWNEASGVELVTAVSSSCSVPGLFPPITIGGRRYMDGGMRSGTNADLATGHEHVLIITLMGGALTGAGAGTGQANPRLQRMRANAERELTALREGGAKSVVTLAPDAEAAAIIGMDLMNAALSYDAAQAGLRQGRFEAERLRAVWG